MSTAALAMRDLLLRLAGWFGIEGGFLVAGAASLAVWAYFAIDSNAPWAVVGIVCLIAWAALTLRRP